MKFKKSKNSQEASNFGLILLISFFVLFIIGIIFVGIIQKLKEKDDINYIQNKTKPHIVIIGTGGAIAGAGSSLVEEGFKAGAIKDQTLLDYIPDLKKLANLKNIQLFNTASNAITKDDLILLSKTVNNYLAQKNVDGILVTVGYDALSEITYFLNLTVKSKKPVVLIGAMRTPTQLSSDTYINLFNGLSVAVNKQSMNKGVLVVVDSNIFSAQDLEEFGTSNVDNFAAQHTGIIGNVEFKEVIYYATSLFSGGNNGTNFDISKIDKLPIVLIVPTYLGDDGIVLKKILNSNQKIKGIVIAGMGDGSFPHAHKKYMTKINALLKKGIIIVRSSMVQGGMLDKDTEDYSKNIIAAWRLNPQESRILLMLGLTKTHDPQKLQQMFYKY